MRRVKCFFSETANEKKLASRIDNSVSSQSYEVIKLTRYLKNISWEYADAEKIKRLVTKDKLIFSINESLKILEDPNRVIPDQYFPKENKFHDSKLDIRKIRKAKSYLESIKGSYDLVWPEKNTILLLLL